MNTAQILALIVATCPLWTAPLVSVAVSTLKASPFPYQGATKAGIVAALTVVAFVLRLATAWASGDLAALDVATETRIIVEALTAAGLAAGAHSIANDEKPLT
jgi:hypothetical protein